MDDLPEINVIGHVVIDEVEEEAGEQMTEPGQCMICLDRLTHPIGMPLRRYRRKGRIRRTITGTRTVYDLL